MSVTIKTKEDIAILREGGKRHAFILRELSKIIKPGIGIAELEEEARRLIKEGGDKSAFLNYTPKGSKRPYPAALCVSINDEVVHGIPNEEERILKDGDIVSLDLGLRHRGLITDAAITVPVGSVDGRLLELIEQTKKALSAGIKAVKDGRRVGDVSAAIQRIGVAHGYGVVEDLAGHGVGYAVHEDPFIPNVGTPGTGERLKAGMVIAIEPMFNLGTKEVELGRNDYTFYTADGMPSAHFEHTVVVTKSGSEILTSLSVVE